MYAKARKFVKRGAKQLRKRYAAKPGGRKGTGGVRVAKMAKDILYLKSVLNPEKKRISEGGAEVPIGQINGNTDGGFFADITPIVSQGTSSSTRNGASIKLYSSMWQFQFVQMVAVVADIKLCIEIWAIDKEPYTGFTWRNEHFTPNQFITGADIRDYNCQTNPDNYMKGRCIARRYATVKCDNVSAVKNIVDVKIPVLYNRGQGRHIRYNKDTLTVESGQLFLCIRADRGNISSSAPSTLTGPVDIGVNTGVNMSYNRIDYFYDN